MKCKVSGVTLFTQGMAILSADMRTKGPLWPAMTAKRQTSNTYKINTEYDGLLIKFKHINYVLQTLYDVVKMLWQYHQYASLPLLQHLKERV